MQKYNKRQQSRSPKKTHERTPYRPERRALGGVFSDVTRVAILSFVKVRCQGVWDQSSPGDDEAWKGVVVRIFKGEARQNRKI